MLLECIICIIANHTTVTLKRPQAQDYMEALFDVMTKVSFFFHFQLYIVLAVRSPEPFKQVSDLHIF